MLAHNPSAFSADTGMATSGSTNMVKSGHSSAGSAAPPRSLGALLLPGPVAGSHTTGGSAACDARMYASDAAGAPPSASAQRRYAPCSADAPTYAARPHGELGFPGKKHDSGAMLSVCGRAPTPTYRQPP